MSALGFHDGTLEFRLKEEEVGERRRFAAY